MASDQLAYAPARPEGDTAQERDDFRLPRQRATATVTAPSAYAGAGAAGLAALPGGAPATLPAPMPLQDAGPGATLAGPPTYDPTALTTPAYSPAPDRADGVETVPATADAPPAEDTSGHLPLPTALLSTAVAAPVIAPGVLSEAPAAPAPAPADPGEALCARILGHVAAQREAVARAEREAVEKAAAEQAAREAAERKVREQVAAAKAAAEQKAREEAAAAVRAEAERLARLAESYLKPVACAALGAGFGEADPWSNLHNGQDFTAPTGTPVHAVHTGTVTSAGWAGSDGYRVVLTLDDGTELRYCHLSTMVVTEGRVTTGDTVGRVGATGNVPVPHLHLEVRPGGGDAIDPLPWLRAHDVAV